MTRRHTPVSRLRAPVYLPTTPGSRLRTPVSAQPRYDAAGRRVGKAMNGVRVQAMLYQDAIRPLAMLDASNQVTDVYVYGSKGNVPDYIDRGGIRYRLISDNVGSVRLVINTSTGAIEQRLDYDEYGNVIRDTNPGFQPFGFAGGLYDPDTKLTRFGARGYDAETGRWIGKDRHRVR